MVELQRGALVVFVSDSHVGGDPGCDGFESPAELQALFEDLAGYQDGPVELVLAGDFFDFLQISETPDGSNKASLTLDRHEYRDMFEALRKFNGGKERRVIYLPGNHDAEAWWNPEIQKTLRERGLVDEFAFSYSACFVEGEKRWRVYCEHGNQFDAANTIEDYEDRLDTPLGHHVVMDFTRRVAPFGEVARGLDMSEIKNVYPLVAIPKWIASRYFYNAISMVAAYLLAPILLAYAIYRVVAYVVAVAENDPVRFFGSYQELPRLHEMFIDIGIFAFLTLLIFAIFFFVVRRAVRRALAAADPEKRKHYSPAEASENRVREILQGGAAPPMGRSVEDETMDVFVSGHTHLPSLFELERSNGERRRVAVNSGCWLRQLQPVSPRLKGPPVFVSKFVLTHVRVYVKDSSLHVELWDHPKPAEQHLTRTERLLSWNRRPPQPSASPKHLRASSIL